MTAGGRGAYTERGGSWRPFWLVLAASAAVVALELAVPGRQLPSFSWPLLVVVPGVVAIGCLSAGRAWTVRVSSEGLAVGREKVRLSEIDADHLRAVDSGVDAGAPVLGGGWSLPRGRTGLPLRLDDGRTVLVPTVDPAALRSALLAFQGTMGA